MLSKTSVDIQGSLNVKSNRLLQSLTKKIYIACVGFSSSYT